MRYRLGKRPARDGAVKFALSHYASVGALPQPPKSFGYLISNWPMFCNDQWGDCVWAGAAHEHMKWGAEGGAVVAFNDTSVLSDYGAVTGFDPSKPDTDQGTDLSEAAAYRRKTGIIDAAGNRHTIDAYVALPLRDPNVVAQAAWLFGAVGIGLQLPSSATEQFDNQVPWDVVEGVSVEGGHYVPVVGRNSAGNFLVVTWGRLHAMTPAFLAAYMDEGLAYLDLDRIKNNLSPEQFDLSTLQADLAALSQPQTSTAQGASQMADKPEGTQLDPDLLAACAIAVRSVVNGFTYDGFNVGSRVTDAEVASVVTAVLVAEQNFKSGPSI